MTRCLLALGSNLGDRQAILAQACAEVEAIPGSQLLARSSWHGTEPIGGAEGQGEFLNGALLLQTELRPREFTGLLQQIEANLGRERVVRWDARTLDIDVLLYGREAIDTAELTVPHPRMAFRSFVLEPAAEIAGEMLHPNTGWTIARLLAHLQNSPRLVVVTGVDPNVVECLVSHLSEALGCPAWPGAEQSFAEAYGSQPSAGVEFSAMADAGPPLVAELCPETVDRFSQAVLAQAVAVRPALVIALDPAKPSDSASLNRFCLPGVGPVARITTSDPELIAQEARAAVRCIWPDID